MSRSMYARLQRRFGKKDDLLSRREALRLSLAAATGLLASCASTGEAPASPARGGAARGRTVVVGAGLAGLAAAYELRAAGYDVVVVEARKRVGGRVLSFSDFVPEKHVEGGAELIGSNHPLWVAYAKRFGLEFLDVTELEDAESPITLGDRRLTRDESEAVWKEMESAAEALNADARKVDSTRPWTSPDAAAFDARAVGAWIDEQPVSPLCRAALHALFSSDNGVATSRQSYLGQLAQIAGGGVERYWTESEVFRCAGGNQRLATALAAALPDGALRLGTPVTAVVAGGGRAAVKLADGATLEADDVVVAVPPSVWSKIAFNPVLPAALLPQMGVNLKILYSVKSRFWIEQGLAPDSLSDGALSQTWEATDGQNAAGGFGLNVFSGGLAAERARAGWGPERIERLTQELGRTYVGLREQVVGARFMDWPGDPWTMAGYSFPAPGEVTAVGPLLEAGIGGRVHFAGEHANYAFVGYMEGALQSGAAVANRVARRDGALA